MVQLDTKLDHDHQSRLVEFSKTLGHSRKQKIKIKGHYRLDI